MMIERAIIIDYNKISHLEHGGQKPRPTEILVPLVVYRLGELSGDTPNSQSGSIGFEP